MQNQYAAENADASAPTPPTGVFQLHLYCKTGDYYLIGTGSTQAPLPKGVWVNFSATFDTLMDLPTWVWTASRTGRASACPAW